MSARATAKFVTTAGDALLLVRNDTAADSAFVGAGVADGELYLLVREQKGGAIRRTALEPGGRPAPMCGSCGMHTIASPC